MTDSPAAALSAIPPSRSRGAWLSLIAGGLIALAVVAAALWPRRPALGLTRPPAIHPHAPDLALIVHAPMAVQWHLAAVTLALVVGVVLLVGVKGAPLHRLLGWTWAIAMMTAAVSSLFIRELNHGRLSLIHLLSGWTILALPAAVAFARAHRVRMHGRMMTGLFTGGLVLAGILSFIPGRLMWRLFF